MLGLKDFFHMPKIDQLVAQLTQDHPGIILVAGLEPRRLSAEEDGAARWLVSGKTTILRILMREIMMAHPREHCIILSNGGEPFRIPRELRPRCEVFQLKQPELRGKWLKEALRRRPGVLVIERLDPETAQTAVEAAAKGMRVLSQVDTIFRGATVARHLESLGVTHTQLGALTWVLTVLRQAVLCQTCKQPLIPDASLWQRLGLPQEEGRVFYRPGSCLQCKGTGRQGEVTVFDVFRAQPQGEDLFSQASLLPAREYLASLVHQGQLAPEDALEFDAHLLHETYAMLEAEEKALVEANQNLRQKVLELEVTNRLLIQRTEAMISFQEIGQTLIRSANLYELANRICRYTRDLCGADLAVVYFNRGESELELMSEVGWEKARLLGRVPAWDLPPVPESGEMRPYLGVPAGIQVADEVRPVIRAGFYVPLVVEGRAVGRMVVQSAQKITFTPGEISMLRTFASQVAIAMQRADLVDELRAKIDQLQAAQGELVQKERLEHELELARQVQQSVLPKKFPEIPGVSFAARNMPARQVGGDFYDVIRLDDRHFGLVVADVSDKGMPAAVYMALARSLILAEAHRDLSPRSVLETVNRLLMELGEPGMFVTTFYGVVDCAGWTLAYARAGHDRPLLQRGGNVIPLGGSGMALGVVDSAQLGLSEEHMALQPGDFLLLYTDGLIDAQAPDGANYGLPRLNAFWRYYAGLKADELCARTFDELISFQAEAEQTDDMTLLVAGFHAANGDSRITEGGAG